MRPLAAIIAIAFSTAVVAQPIQTPASADPSWAAAEAVMAQRAGNPVVQERAKNVILFVGDGMGISTIAAARIYEAQKRARDAGGQYPGFAGGEENYLSFERFPATALVKTYNTNAQVPDSAGTATAFSTGAKTRIGVIGILPGQSAETCRTPAAFPRTLGELAREAGMGLGVVTTTRITHATPAAIYAHVPNRDWEGADTAYPAAARASGCKDIATQMVEFQGLDVMLGGGKSRFRPMKAGGNRDDGRDLIGQWRKANRKGQFVEGAASFRKLDPATSGPVLGLFNDDHLAFNIDANRDEEPSLAEMATFAIRKLQAQGKGYVLMVEGGRIDHAHHITSAYRALDEAAELSRAVEEVLKLVDPKDTLVMVTADHSHVFTMAGYPPRGNDILGYIRPLEGAEGNAQVSPEGWSLDDLGRPMPTLGYQNGPRKMKIGDKTLSAEVGAGHPDYLPEKLHGLRAETHGGEDVALYATGPGSGLVHGAIEQNLIFHIIANALGWR